ncbi:MAG: aminoacyl-tRNA hydrolase [Bradymonadales bacterium]|nr:aminoacyl-tRNA hydrolase [Bradymonadales bacterium]
MSAGMEADLPIADGIVIPGSELWFTASRSGGPGGQNVNKTSTKILLHWSCNTTTALPEPLKQRLVRRLRHRINAEGVLLVQVEDTRSQQQNLQIARDRLAELVRQAIAEPKRRLPTRPTTHSIHRRLELKRQRSRTKAMRRRPGPEE